MTILVTGASGLIGSHLCEELVKEQHDIVALARLVSPLLESILREHPERITFAVCDIRDIHEVERLIGILRPETVFHLAACCLPYHDDAAFINTNVRGTANLVLALRQNEASELMFASSLSVYSTPPEYLPVNEHHPTQSNRVYGKSKLAGEHMCDCLSNAMRVVSLRFAGTFGVGDMTRVAGLFAEAALSDKPLQVQGDGHQSSDFIYVDDAVQGILLAWEKEATGVYNIGSGRPTTIKELAQTIIRIAESKSKVELSGSTHMPFRFIADITKARASLGYQPMSLEKGLEKYVERLRALEHR